MPGFIARKLCPDLVIVPTNFEKYTEVSKQVKSIIADYDPNYCPMSLDEAYLDITEHLLKRRLTSDAERTFVCRESSYAHSRAHCLCDLNMVLSNHDSAEISLVDNASSDLKSEKKNIDNDGKGEMGIDSNANIDLKQKRTRVCSHCGKEFPPFERKTFGLSDEDAVMELRTRIEQKTRLTASAGTCVFMLFGTLLKYNNRHQPDKLTVSNSECIRM